jgi:hypothetical protein
MISPTIENIVIQKMISRGDKIRLKSGKLSLLFELLAQLKHQLDKPKYNKDIVESLIVDIYDLFTQEDINLLSMLFKEIYNSPNIPLDEGETIFKTVNRS